MNPTVERAVQLRAEAWELMTRVHEALDEIEAVAPHLTPADLERVCDELSTLIACAQVEFKIEDR